MISSQLRRVSLAGRALVISGALCAIAVPNSAWATQVIGVTYESPGDSIFTWIQSASAAACPYVIINAPDNGNLVSGDSQYIATSSWSPSLASWTALSSTLHAHGVKVICYVDSGDTNRTQAQVEADMAKYLADGFTVDGFFVDDVAWGWSGAAGDGSGTIGNWYTNLYNYAHNTLTTKGYSLYSSSPTVIINPGGVGDSASWMGACDIDVDFEGPYQTFTGVTGTVFSGYTSWSPTGTWATSYPASRFLNIITNVPNTSTVDTIFAGATTHNTGLYFTTNVSCDWQAGVNTYGTDPTQSIWNEEIAKATSGSTATIYNVSEAVSGGNLKISYYYTGAWTYYHVFLDTDRKATTGYTIAGIGADYLVENGGIYKSTANGTGWNWSSVGSATFTNSAGVATFSIPLSSIGSPAHFNAAYQVAASSTSYTTAEYTY